MWWCLLFFLSFRIVRGEFAIQSKLWNLLSDCVSVAWTFKLYVEHEFKRQKFLQTRINLQNCSANVVIGF